MNPIPLILSLSLLSVAVSAAHAGPGFEPRRLIDSYLTSQWGEGNVSWVTESMPDSSLFAIPGRWSVAGPDLPRGKVVLHASVEENGSVLRRIPLRIRVMPFAWVPVLDKARKRGDVVDSGAVVWKRREVTEIRRDWPKSIEEISVPSLRARRSLSPGEVITWQDVEPMPPVRFGETVTLTLQRGSVLVETRGIAMQDGRDGEIIRVEQEELGNFYKAIVTGEGHAEILGVLGRQE